MQCTIPKKFSNWICRNTELEKFTIWTGSKFWKTIKMLNIGVLCINRFANFGL